MSVILLFHYAGLGNKLFELAFAYSCSQRLNRKLWILDQNLKDPHNNNEINDWLTNIFDKMLLKNVKLSEYKVAIEHESLCCSIDCNLLKNISENQNIIVNGYFQTHHYFQKYRNDLLRLFKCPDNVQQKINMMDFDTNSFFLHVRLGDYLKCRHHLVDLTNYYETCLTKVFEQDKFAKVYMFSDDVENIYKMYPNLKKFNFQIISEKDHVVSLFMMANCSRGGICANSTFSWWGSYLNPNPNKRVFMPGTWFNPNDKLGNHKIDLYYDGVEVVSV